MSAPQAVACFPLQSGARARLSYRRYGE